MKRTNTLFEYTLFFLLCLLTFLVIFEQWLVLPKSIQVLGRLHPLVLHLPIGLMVALVLLPVTRKVVPEDSFSILRMFLLNLFTFSLFISAIAGLLLAQEEGYRNQLIFWHKWTAISASYVTYLLLLLPKYFPQKSRLLNAGLFLNFVLITLVGHLGGSVTHGQDFLIEPIKTGEAKVITPQSSVFEATIQPIFDAKCKKCHHPNKRKGQLDMTSEEAFRQGGKNGPVWVAGQPDSSHLIQRLQLATSDEKHMPPVEQTQLTSQEIKLIYYWIKAGANFQTTIESIPTTDSLYQLLQPLLNTHPEQDPAVYNFPPAKKRIVQKLNTPYRTVHPVAQGSPALSVEFFIQQAFELSYLEELRPIRKQITEINLSNMPMGDKGLKLVSDFPNLEKIILNGTGITGANLAELVQCKKLASIALSNTSVKKSDLFPLAALPYLSRLYFWETEITEKDLPELQKNLPGVTFDFGYQANPNEKLKLSPPVLVAEKTVMGTEEQVQLSTKFPGAEIRYTINGSNPDSLTAQVFSEPIFIADVTTIKARTYCKNWVSSDVVEFTLFPAGKTPDTAILVTPANPQYVGEGPKSLTDKVKGKISNFKTPAWLGYQDNPLIAIFDFGETPPEISQIVGSFGQNMGPEIFLPKRIRIFGGSNPENLSLLGTMEPSLADGYQPNKVIGLPMEIEPSNYRYYRIEVFPYERLPKWHQSFSSGRKTWVFIDEVFFY